ncbi:hypothetical protein LTR85_009444 [Meristemomyces frigidus]|nr:hypothetical protein LTR85_009444 [Meristemomyces frigidus]
MDHSPLARLPAELRNEIYELALTQAEAVVDIGQRWEWRARGGGIYQVTSIGEALAITKTCKQIRQESASIFFSTNTFDIKLDTEFLFHNRPERSSSNFQQDVEALLEPLHAFIDTIGEGNATMLCSAAVTLGTPAPMLIKEDLGDEDSKAIFVAGLCKLLDWLRGFHRLRLVMYIRLNLGNSLPVQESRTRALDFQRPSESIAEALQTV